MDISLLPEEMRGREEEERRRKNGFGKKFVPLSVPTETPRLGGVPPTPAPPSSPRLQPPPRPTLPAPSLAPPPTPPKRNGNGKRVTPPALTVAARPPVKPAPPREQGPVLRVSLIPHDGAPGAAGVAGRRMVILALILGAAVVGLPAVTLSVIGAARKVRVRALEAEIADQKGKIREADAALTPVRNAERAIKSLSLLLDNHRQMSAAFGAIERATIPEVSYIQLSSEGERGFSLQAVGPDFTSVARQIVALRQSPDFDSVKVQSAAADISPSGEIRGVSFAISLSVKPEAIRAKEQ